VIWSEREGPEQAKPDSMMPHERGTIVARATGHGQSARAIVRVSGPASREIRDFVASTPSSRLCVGSVEVAAGVACPVLCAFFAGPKSFTGEDVLEITLPGNPALVERVIDSLCASGRARRAQPGEFSARAFMSGRLTLSQAEGIAAGIAAQTDAQWEAAGRIRSGAAGAEHRAWAWEVTSLLALVEAGIDFTDQEDVVPIPPAELVRRIDALRARLCASAGSPAESLAARAAPVAAFVGRPNAGKSTLFNALIGRRRAGARPPPPPPPGHK
jgi:tRNA modification GTPase